MLIQRLREAADQRSDLPPPYYRYRAVRWAIYLDADGYPTSEELADLSGADQPAGIQLPAPYVYRAGRKPPAALLVDSLQYVLGMPKDTTDKEIAEAKRRCEDYVDLIARWRESAPDDPVAQAVHAFFARGGMLPIPEQAKPTDTVAIWACGQWAHLRPSAVEFWGTVVRGRKSTGAAGICLACGQPGALLDTLPESIKAGAIPAVGGRGHDAQPVSINKPAQGRGGKIQLANTPICDVCGNRAMAALNAMLADDAHRRRLRDSVMVWWLRDPSDGFNYMVLDEPQPEDVRALLDLLDTPRAWQAEVFDHNAFYGLTMSVNQSRVVIRDWLEVPVQQVKLNIARWFADHRSVDRWRDGLHVVPLWQLIRAAGRWDTVRDTYIADSEPHSCGRDLLMAALRGTRLPAYLLPHLLRRIRADHHLDLPRAALLRLILNRSNPKVECPPMLNPDGPVPYQCGRLFAVFEAMQRQAIDNLNTTIADKFLGAASITPRPILLTLRRTAQGHLKKLRRKKPGAAIALEARFQEITDRLDDYPATLQLADQAQFFLGYDHQRAYDAAARAAKAATNDN